MAYFTGNRIAIDVTVEYSMKDSVLSVYVATDQDFSLEGQGDDGLSPAIFRAARAGIVRDKNGVRLFTSLCPPSRGELRS